MKEGLLDAELLELILVEFDIAFGESVFEWGAWLLEAGGETRHEVGGWFINIISCIGCR